MTSDEKETPKSEVPEEAGKSQSSPTDSEPTIDLAQFLKTCGVETGGQAKHLIQGGEILLNGKVETRRRKKLRVGDEVTLFDDVFIVGLAEEDDVNS